jgi:transposase
VASACFIVATNVLDESMLSEEEVVSTYKGQGGVERGFRFLCISLVAGLLRVPQKARAHRRAGVDQGALLGTVSRLAEHRLRTRLAETEQTVPDQLNRPTARPPMRWILQCCEGIELLHIHSASEMQSLILRVQPLHRLVLAVLGPPYEKIYTISS